MSATDRPPLVNAEGQQIVRFSEFVASHRRGSVDDEISHALHHVIGEVNALEKKGTLNLQITVTSDGDQQIAVAVDVVPKAPRQSAATEHFYLDRHGNPTRTDPYQQRIEERGGHLTAVDPQEDQP